MLQSLSIRNFVLIDELTIQFTPHFSVITGETGAGKSIILGAIALLMGPRADHPSRVQYACARSNRVTSRSVTHLVADT